MKGFVGEVLRGGSIFFCFMVGVSGYASADDYLDTDFSLRLPAALAKFSPYSDVAGFGGASAGSRYASSVNPAATDWQNTSERPIFLSPQFNAITFGNGPTLRVIAEAVTFKTAHAGSLQLVAAQVRNNGTASGNFLLLDADYGSVQWSYKLSPAFALGANFNYTAFRTRGGSEGMLVADSHSDTYGGRVGALFAPLPNLLTGLVIDYSRTPAKTKFLEPNCACFIPGHDTTANVLVRPGLSYEYSKQSSIYADFQHGSFKNATGSFSTNRVFTGVEQQVLDWLFGRAGLVYDFRGSARPTFGLGLYPTEGLSIDIAYQHDVFPELRPEFGRSNLFSLSAAWTF
jgi:hypothetical protein